eukprot:1715041-Amphidinium_carterae.1
MMDSQNDGFDPTELRSELRESAQMRHRAERLQRHSARRGSKAEDKNRETRKRFENRCREHACASDTAEEGPWAQLANAIVISSLIAIQRLRLNSNYDSYPFDFILLDGDGAGAH